jgi:hypothetical protein
LELHHLRQKAIPILGGPFSHFVMLCLTKLFYLLM